LGAHGAETDLTLDDVYRADEAFCPGRMGELVCGRELFTRHSLAHYAK
jgi:hypothetical protein